jgi:hypothetical protein
MSTQVFELAGLDFEEEADVFTKDNVRTMLFVGVLEQLGSETRESFAP